MSEDTVPTVERFYGTPDEWASGLYDLCRYVDEGERSRQSLGEWVPTETDSEHQPNVDAVLAFLVNVGILEDSEAGYSLAEAGRTFLDTGDPTVVYEALASEIRGFDTLLDSLAVRPLTDVEVADVLEQEYDTDLDSSAARPYREWLAALGVAVHDGGVNELTAEGYRLTDVESGMRPPGGAPESDVRVTDADSTLSDTSDSDIDSAADRDDGRDDETAETLKSRYDDTCMVCGDRRQRSADAGFSHVHYFMPPESPHDGPETPENAVVVCPNHRADFEHGMVTVDPQTLEIDHAYDPDVSGRTLRTVGGHDLGGQYLAYHNDVLA